VNPAEIVGLVVGALAIVTAIISGLVWLIRSQLAMQREFKPNGGASTRDALNRIEKDLRDIRGRVDDHVEWHMDQR
jgi:hypothetical protein